MLITEPVPQWLGQASPPGSPGKRRAADAARTADDLHQEEVTAGSSCYDGVVRLAAALSEGIVGLLAPFHGETETRLS